jgi:hypothetical protein
MAALIGAARAALLGGLSTYIGQVATRSAIHNNTASFGATNQANTRSRHFMRSRTGAIAIVIPTWWFNAATLAEVALGGTPTVTAAIEYNGTFTQVTWGGAASKVCPDNANTISDYIPVSIPVGSAFFIRVFWTGAAFINATNLVGPPTKQACRDEANGERWSMAASGLTDLTMGGTITSTHDNVGFSPVAIVGRTSDPSILAFGDSRCIGAYDLYNDASTNVGVGRIVGPSFPYINIGSFGDSAVNFATAGKAPRRIELAQYCNHIVSEMGINGISGGRTGAQVAGTDLPACWALLQAAGGPAKRIIQTTLAPITTSTDAWTTTANQTVAAANQARIDFNNLVRAVLAGTIGSIDLALVAESSLDSGKWRIDTITAHFTASQTTTVMTVTAVADGTLALSDTIAAPSGGPAAKTAIHSLGTGTGGTGTYNMFPSQSVTSRAMVANVAANDGIHEGPKMNDLYRTAGAFNSSLVH